MLWVEKHQAEEVSKTAWGNILQEQNCLNLDAWLDSVEVRDWAIYVRPDVLQSSLVMKRSRDHHY